MEDKAEKKISVFSGFWPLVTVVSLGVNFAITNLSWSLAISGAIGFSIMLYYAVKKMGLKIWYHLLVTPLAAAIPVWAITYFLIPKKGLMTGVALTVMFGLFLILYSVFGGHDSDDIKTFEEIMDSINNPILNAIKKWLVIFVYKSPFFEWYKRWA